MDRTALAQQRGAAPARAHRGGVMIPRVIHQTWRGADLPAPFARLAETWRRHHPQWQWRLWTDTDNRAFVGAHFPAMLGLYDSYPHPIQRVDIVRYLILHVHGG